MELTEVVNGSPQAEPTAEPVREPPAPAETGDTPAPEPRDDRPRDEHGRFAPKPRDEARTEPAPPAGRHDHGPIPIQALLDEREKRQALQRERDDYARQLQYLQQLAYQQQRQQEAPPPPDPYSDPQGFREFVRAEARVEADRYRQEALTRHYDWLVADAEQRWPDYRQAEEAFLVAAKANRALGEQMAQAPNPAAFAYQVGKQMLALRDIGDPVSYRDRVVDDDELFNRMLEKRGLNLQQLQSPPPQPALSFPSSLSTARSAAPRQSTAAFSGPTPLSALGNPALRMG